jgi:hypothetical protein
VTHYGTTLFVTRSLPAGKAAAHTARMSPAPARERSSHAGFASAERSPKPFLPADMDASRVLPRAVLAHCVAATQNDSPASVARKLWRKDHPPVVALIERASVVPAATTATGWAQELAAQSTGAFLASLLPSAGAALLAASPRFDLSGKVRINLPHASSTGMARWIAEGAPIPVADGVLSTVALGPANKLCVIEVLSREVAEHSAEDGEAVVTMILQAAARNALDASLFSSAAGTPNNPPGLLAGITPTTATAGAAGMMAALSDMRALIDAIVASGGGQDIRFFASPGRAVALKAYCPDVLAYPSAAIPAGELIAIDVAGFASGFSSAVEIRASTEVTLHMEDTTPLPISTPGTPNTVAAPVRSAFQSDVIALRMILRAAWCMRQPGAVAYISTGLSW